jgi:hypothetical protein
MPFTCAHPALVIPLLYAQRRYRWLSVTGLITGSVAPDFEKFFRLKLASSHSHTIASIFYFSCPVAIGLAFVFHLIVRRPLIAHLPLPLYGRFSKYKEFNWFIHFRRCYIGVVLSVVVGAALHLFWDSFTHFHPSMNRLLPALAIHLQFGQVTVPVFQIVGLVSSGFGIIAIAAVIWLMPVQLGSPAPVPTVVHFYWRIVTVTSVVLTTTWIMAIRPRLLDSGITAISATLVGIIVASVYTSSQCGVVQQKRTVS